MVLRITRSLVGVTVEVRGDTTESMKTGDVYVRSVQQQGQITARMVEDGMRVFDAYLRLYLPYYLPKRDAYREYLCIRLRNVTSAYGSGV